MKKIIKFNKILSLMFFLLVSYVCKAQSNWITIFSNDGKFSFQMPSQPGLYDTTNNVYYYLSIDTTINMQVNYVTPDTALNPVDVLDLFARTLIFTTQGELVSIQDTTLFGINNINGKEIGVKYWQEEDQVFTFVLVYYWETQLLAFTISASQTYLTDLINYKNLFFNSVLIFN
jgi:hypothetical protein